MFEYLKNKSNEIKSIGRMFCSLKRISNKYKNYDEYLISLPTIKNINIKGIDVKISVDDDAVMASGYRFGMAKVFTYENKLNFIIVIEENVYSIFGNTDMANFIIYHEIGHFVNEVIGQMFIVGTRTLENEINADIYAAQIIGAEKALRALNYMKKENVDREEISKRIEAIEQYA